MFAKKSKTISSWGAVFAWAFLAGLLALVAIQLNSAQRGVLTRGEPAPEFTLTTFEGEVIGPENLVGKVVLVNFWASWCKPCEQEAAALQSAWELYEPRGDVLFVGVDYADTQNEALAYLKRFAITYPNGPDLGIRIYYAFRARGVPETFIINKLGEVAFVKIGPFESLDEITMAIDRLLEP
ncbi:MAG: TlpA family protein disulfide reductase [Chloroflexi bacterium]|nr:TlpA family protein disulfide reductase [Chloroflexota bacterium]